MRITELSQQNPILKDIMERPWGNGALLVMSNSDDADGVGTLIPIPYAEIVEITHDDDGFTVMVVQRENPDLFEGFDILFIGNIEEWCKESKEELIKNF